MSDGRLVFVGGGAGRPLTLRTSSDAAVSFSDHLEVYTTDLPDYDGPYVAVPSWARQDFPTSERAMRDDFTVQPMLELETPNEAGGLTLTI